MDIVIKIAWVISQEADEYSKDYVERDERRLADLGRKAVEMLTVSLIFKELQVQSPHLNTTSADGICDFHYPRSKMSYLQEI